LDGYTRGIPRGEKAREIHNDKLSKAEVRREAQRQEEQSRLRAASERVDAVLAMSRIKKERELSRIHRKLEAGAAKREEFLQSVVHKALNENVKVDEVRFIKEVQGNEINFELLDAVSVKLKESEMRREAHLEQKRAKALRKASRAEGVIARKNEKEKEEAERHHMKLMKEQEVDQRREAALTLTLTLTLIGGGSEARGGARAEDPTAEDEGG